MSPSQERKTLARLSMAAGSAMTLAAAWLGVLRVEQPAALPDGAEANLALSQEVLSAAGATPPTAASPSSTPTVPAPTPGVAGATARTVVTPAATVPATPPATAPTALVTPAAAATVKPATTPAPVPTPRIVTRRSRAS